MIIINIIGITRILNLYIGTEKEMKKKVAEFAARLKEAKERTLLDQPRQRKPTKKALQLQRKDDPEEEEITKQPLQNAKPKPKKKESEAEKGKENAGEKEKAVPIENKDKEKAKPKTTNKRKATTDKDKSEKHVTKAKKSLLLLTNIFTLIFDRV